MSKQDNREADQQVESLTDLPVTDEQAEETKAGGSHGTGAGGGKVSMNRIQSTK